MCANFGFGALDRRSHFRQQSSLSELALEFLNRDGGRFGGIRPFHAAKENAYRRVLVSDRHRRTNTWASKNELIRTGEATFGKLASNTRANRASPISRPFDHSSIIRRGHCRERQQGRTRTKRTRARPCRDEVTLESTPVARARLYPISVRATVKHLSGMNLQQHAEAASEPSQAVLRIFFETRAPEQPSHPSEIAADEIV